MYTAILAAMVTVFLTVTALLQKKGRDIDLKKGRLNQVRYGREELKPARDNKPKTERKSVLMMDVKDYIRKKQRERLIQQQKQNRKISKSEIRLEQAGLYMTTGQLNLIKLVCSVIMCILAYGFVTYMELGNQSLVIAIPVGIALGLLLPSRWLVVRTGKRQSVYRDSLPDMMDMLVVSVEAGLGFDAALMRLYEKDKSPLMEEIIHTIRDVQHGMTRKEAYRNASLRCGVKELTSFFNSIVQAEQLGISIKTVLKTQSETLREDRRNRAEEKALKAPVTMLIPMVIFIFPVIFIVLLGPALVNIMDVFEL